MNANLQKPILVMAGGTGGHVFPALAVAERLREQGEKIIWLGTRNGIEARVVPAANFAIEWFSVQGLRGKGIASLLLAPVRLLRACWQALAVLRRNRPKAVLGMGGFVSGPGGLMAWILRIPLFVHEQNAVLGLTNRLLTRLATRSYFAFPEAAAGIPRSECVGNPVRAELYDMEEPENRIEARAGSPIQVLVIGGSLGAAALNRLVPEAVACLDPGQRPLIRHQCGERHLEACEEAYRKARVEANISRFIEDMREAYSWADLVICRAGALTIAELAAAGVGSILVPFPYAVDDHQYHNALFLQRRQAAQIMRESELNAESLALKIQYFQQNRPVLVSMARQARNSFMADATERVAAGIRAGAGS